MKKAKEKAELEAKIFKDQPELSPEIREKLEAANIDVKLVDHNKAIENLA